MVLEPGSFLNNAYFIFFSCKNSFFADVKCTKFLVYNTQLIKGGRCIVKLSCWLCHKCPKNLSVKLASIENPITVFYSFEECFAK